MVQKKLNLIQKGARYDSTNSQEDELRKMFVFSDDKHGIKQNIKHKVKLSPYIMQKKKERRAVVKYNNPKGK